MAHKDEQIEDIATHIRRLYDSLSDSQKRVVEFLLSAGIDGLIMSSSQIGAQVNVNRSTVVRTAQALGFRGFTDFQTALQQHFSRQYSGLNQLEIDIGSQHILEALGGESGETSPHSVLP